VKIKMLKTQAGSPDGLTVRVYQKDRRYDLPKALAEVFIEEGWARLAMASRTAKSKPDRKNLDAAPENKAVQKPALKNK